DGELAKAIADAADEVAAGKYDGDFPIDVFQTGSGTSSNMNTNEVIAELASRALKAAGSDKVVHPNDHVNASQSSNDVFPTSVHVAATSALINDLIPALGYLAESLERKAVEFKDVVKSGRTHLMDATPVTLGQEFGGYAAQVRYGIERINASLPRVAEVPLGGTAVGTGINTPAGFPERVIELLATDTGLPLTEARDHFEAQANRDGLIEASSQLRNIAISFMKINNDLRWMGSGPNTGLGEIAIPDLQPGSSIMPGKVNPVICEASIMVAAQVIGNDTAIAWSGTNGAFELNVGIPVMASNLLESIRLLANTSRVMADKMIDGITANVERARFLAEASPSIVTPLNKYIGYENAAKIAKTAVAEGLTVRQATEKLGFVGDGEGKVSEADLDKALDVTTMTAPAHKA
ncbi:MAG: fumarase, partial [Pseudarthrobacter sp.]|nr:fumarase [Pseudarthrobacter sp.]